MKNIRTHILLIVALILATTSIATYAQDNQRNGYWWSTVDRDTKNALAFGLMQGQVTGYFIALTAMRNVGTGTIEQEKVGKQYLAEIENHMKQITNNALAIQIDAFYINNPRYKKLPVHFAFWLVENELLGTPRSEIIRMAESSLMSFP